MMGMGFECMNLSYTDGRHCETCGFNRQVHEKRLELLRQNGMVRAVSRGKMLRTLVIPNKMKEMEEWTN